VRRGPLYARPFGPPLTRSLPPPPLRPPPSLLLFAAHPAPLPSLLVLLTWLSIFCLLLSPPPAVSLPLFRPRSQPTICSLILPARVNQDDVLVFLPDYPALQHSAQLVQLLQLADSVLFPHLLPPLSAYFLQNINREMKKGILSKLLQTN
jgi:hypothetical protein